MTDDPAVALDETAEKTAKTETADAAEQAASPTGETVTEQSVPVPVEAEEEESSPDGGDAIPPDVTATESDDSEPPVPSRRRISQLVGTLLIAGGILTILLTIGITAWTRHQHAAETQAFLSRVTTPTTRAGTPVSQVPATPFPSTISGALVPDRARTPTANVGTRAAQPVATTSDGRNRTIIAAVPPPTATPPPPATPADGSSPSATPSPPPPEPKPKMPIPTHLMIPALKVDSSVVEVGISPIEVDGQQVNIWDVAPYAVGHHFSSANPGEGENVVLSGHDDWQGEVFRDLWRLKKGDEIDVQAGDRQISYHVDEILLLPEIGESLEKRIENAKFIGTTGDERLTLVTCWPYGVDDHRLIVIAHPNR